MAEKRPPENKAKEEPAEKQPMKANNNNEASTGQAAPTSEVTAVRATPPRTPVPVNQGAGPSGLQPRVANLMRNRPPLLPRPATPSPLAAEQNQVDIDAQLVLSFQAALQLNVNHLATQGTQPPPPSPTRPQPNGLTGHSLETRNGVVTPESMSDYRLIEVRPQRDRQPQSAERIHYNQFLLSAYNDLQLLPYFNFSMLSAMYNFSCKAESRLREMWNEPEAGTERSMLIGVIGVYRKLRTILWGLLLKKMDTLEEMGLTPEDDRDNDENDLEEMSLPPPKYPAPPLPPNGRMLTPASFSTAFPPKRLDNIREESTQDQEEEEDQDEDEEEEVVVENSAKSNTGNKESDSDNDENKGGNIPPPIPPRKNRTL